MAGIIRHILTGTRIFISSNRNRFFKKKYGGNAREISQQIISDCWNGRYFQTSTRNFAQFWARDFGWCCKSLLELGFQQEVHQTLRYALNRYKHYNKTATTLTPKGRPFDFPVYAVDTLPWLIHSIKLSKFSYYSYKDFLNKEIRKFFNLIVDQNTGLVKTDAHFSSMKDFSVRKSSCYDNCMVAMLANDLKQMKNLDNPFKKYNYPEKIKIYFWNGRYFYDDLTKQDYISGDANVFPFALGIINDNEMLKSALESIHETGLDEPWPLKYTASRENIKFVWQEIFMRDYESDAIWMHMGPLYVKLLKDINSELYNRYKDKYTEIIEHHKNFLEVYDGKGRPFSSFYYYCDSGMLWAANYLTL